MSAIKLKGKEFELKFTYLAILTLERHYKIGIGKLFNELDLENVGTLTTFIWACLKQEKEFKNKSVDDVAQAINDSLESGDLTFEELGEALSEAVENSVLVKQVGGVGEGAEKK